MKWEKILKRILFVILLTLLLLFMVLEHGIMPYLSENMIKIFITVQNTTKYFGILVFLLFPYFFLKLLWNKKNNLQIYEYSSNYNRVYKIFVFIYLILLTAFINHILNFFNLIKTHSVILNWFVNNNYKIIISFILSIIILKKWHKNIVVPNKIGIQNIVGWLKKPENNTDIFQMKSNNFKYNSKKNIIETSGVTNKYSKSLITWRDIKMFILLFLILAGFLLLVLTNRTTIKKFDLNTEWLKNSIIIIKTTIGIIIPITMFSFLLYKIIKKNKK